MIKPKAMLINKNTAISTSRILLVPYEEHHVPTYHSWMKDEEIQAATASEPLSLEEEYTMQQSWRHDADKLTFIACQPVSSRSQSPSPCPRPSPPTGSASRTITAQADDRPSRMLGDINLFLTSADEDAGACIGEIELMIAPPAFRRKGYGRAALLAFLAYVERHLGEILEEYHKGGVAAVLIGGDEKTETKMELLMLRVKIGSKNASSINLFQSIGFVRVSEGENYFGEVELVFEGSLGRGAGRMEELLKRWGVGEYEEVGYCRNV